MLVNPHDRSPVPRQDLQPFYNLNISALPASTTIGLDFHERRIIMKGKASKAALLALTVSLILTGVAYAEDNAPGDRVQATGKIMSLELEASTFNLQTNAGEVMLFQVDDNTRYRSPGGSVGGLGDLEVGMRAFVIGLQQEDGVLLARLVIAGDLRGQRELVNAVGKITEIDVASGSFSISNREGEIVSYQTGDRTRYRGRDGSIQGMEDLEQGMVALVVGLQQEDGEPLAIMVAAGYKEDIPDNLVGYRGEITGVVPGQGTFTLETQAGESLTFQTSDRTRFRSRDGEVEDIHDLKQGMTAIVGALEQDDGTLLAFFVGVGYPQEGWERPIADVWSIGRIVELGERSFTVEARDGESKEFSVDGSTVYRSRDGSIDDFDDLEEGMRVLVGAKELGSGQLKVVWVGAMRFPADRPTGEQDSPSTVLRAHLFVENGL
jgi:hypothetical protein